LGSLLKLWGWRRLSYRRRPSVVKIPSTQSLLASVQEDHFLVYPREPLRGKACAKESQDLLRIIKLLKDRPDDSLSQLLENHFMTYAGRPSQANQLRAFHLAIRNMIMIQCSLKGSSLARWKPGFAPIVWKGDDSMRKLIATTFPMKDPLSLDGEHGSSIGLQLSARRLRGVHKVAFRGTGNLRRHLFLDTENKIIYIFHYTAFLKEHLIWTYKGDSNNT